MNKKIVLCGIFLFSGCGEDYTESESQSTPIQPITIDYNLDKPCGFINQDCASGYECILYACSKRCQNNADCKADSYCYIGQCEQRCNSDEMCNEINPIGNCSPSWEKDRYCITSILTDFTCKNTVKCVEDCPDESCAINCINKAGSFTKSNFDDYINCETNPDENDIVCEQIKKECKP